MVQPFNSFQNTDPYTIARLGAFSPPLQTSNVNTLPMSTVNNSMPYDTVNLSSQPATTAQPKEEGMSTLAKVGIAVGTVATAAAAVYLFKNPEIANKGLTTAKDFVGKGVEAVKGFFTTGVIDKLDDGLNVACEGSKTQRQALYNYLKETNASIGENILTKLSNGEKISKGELTTIKLRLADVIETNPKNHIDIIKKHLGNIMTTGQA
ncbi:MAG: hypothetical protein PHC34_08745 [Candidatus Gastranaerophilales bacterium]|nr:hypothetical protein [Candidatus Gastranaerophilales bacterium]